MKTSEAPRADVPPAAPFEVVQYFPCGRSIELARPTLLPENISELDPDQLRSLQVKPFPKQAQRGR